MRKINRIYIIIVLITFMACNRGGSDDDATQLNIVGSWFSNLDSTFFDIHEDNSFEIHIFNHVEPVISGEVDVKNQEILIVNDKEDVICNDTKGKHRYFIRGDTLIFEEIEEDCIERRVHLKKRFIRYE